MDEKPIYAVIYARVSTGSEQQAGSIPTQISRCRSYCDAMGWTIKEECFDQGITGTTLDRPGWKRVEELVKSGKVNMVVSTSLDRLARTDEFMPWLREVLHPANADFATIAERIDTSSAAGRLALGILIQIAQFQAEQTKEKTTAALQFRAEQGFCVVHPPFGTKPGEIKGIPEKNTETWPWLEFIFEKAAAGMPHYQILNTLRDNHVKGPKGGEMGRSTLDHIIANPFYIGVIRHKDKEYKAKHGCLIDEKTWKAAQWQKKAKRGRQPEIANYLLRGMVITDQLQITTPEKDAGKPVPMTPYFSKGRNATYPSYYRQDRRRKYGGVKAEVVNPEDTKWLASSVPANQLDEAVMDSLIQMASADQQEILLVRAEQAAEGLREEMRSRKARKEEELHSTKAELKKLSKATLEGAGSATARLMQEWDQQLKDLDLREQILIGEIQACDDVTYRLEQTRLETEATIEQLNTVQELRKSEDWTALREVLEILVDKVIVRAHEKTYEVRVQLNPLPVIREVFETIPNMQKAPAVGLEPTT